MKKIFLTLIVLAFTLLSATQLNVISELFTVIPDC